MLTHIIESYIISVELAIPDFKILDSIDYINIVEPALRELGAYDIDIDKMFGPFVAFTVDNTDMIEPIKEKIEQLVREYS